MESSGECLLCGDKPSHDVFVCERCWSNDREPWQHHGCRWWWSGHSHTQFHLYADALGQDSYSACGDKTPGALNGMSPDRLRCFGFCEICRVAYREIIATQRGSVRHKELLHLLPKANAAVRLLKGQAR